MITYSNFSKNNNKYFKEFKKEVKDNFVYNDSESQAQTQNIRTAIVCMTANENLYIRDFVKWHLKLGFTKIFIGDNSPVNGEHPDIFDQENLVAMKLPSDEELEKYILYVRRIIRGEAEWTY